ncbi:MAG TPA: LPS assembly lipoprotein LptE [Chitinophagaceae bacterium]|nr:LPS assembly lipoprotein LptE [Chitinophagaceae bacterium]
MLKQKNYLSQVRGIALKVRTISVQDAVLRNSETNVQECDATGDSISIAAGPRKKTSGQFKINNFLFFVSCFLFFAFSLSSCGIYTFKDVTIPPEVKTIKINFLENRASYRNPQLSPRLTDQLQQKIASQTRLTRVNSDDAHYQVSGYISNYAVSTSAISSQSSGSRQQTATNRLTVGVHITLLNTLDNKTSEYDVSRDFEFSASRSFQDAEASLFDDIVKNMTDEIFNRLFSNW